MKLADLRYLFLSNRCRILILFVLFTVSLVMKVSLTLNNYYTFGTEKWVDAIVYLEHGKNFSDGDFYPTQNTRNYGYMLEAPMLPLLVASSQKLFNDPILPVLIVNCLVSSFLVFVLFYIGLFVVNAQAGYILAVWSIVNPYFITYNYQIIKEPLVIFLVPCLVLLFLQMRRKNSSLTLLVISATVFSILIHTDERFFMYFPVLILSILVINKVSRVKVTLIWVVMVVISMIPWTVKNYFEHGQVIILTPRTTAFSSMLWGSDLAQQHFGARVESSQGSSTSMDSATDTKSPETIKHNKNLDKYLLTFVHYWQPTYFRTHKLFFKDSYQRWSLNHNIISLVFYGIFLPLYLAGFYVSVRLRNYTVLFLASIPLIHSLVHTIMIWPVERYRIPLSFIIVLTALWSYSAIMHCHRNKRNEPASD